MAEQMEPVKRRVALKVIKLGMDTKEVIARFEQERQALAMMDHPNIARVLDAGATRWGRPFFVMELVRGVPITSFCDEQKLPVPERLALFIEVCHAVQHAHQKGIIHRDLKPSNILVAPGDGDTPLPKIIDFGVAKAMDRTLTERTLCTRLDQMIGTPAYMSPEQADTGSFDIDTRSDIYSLGVILYEMLTGAPPFDSRDLLRAGPDEMRRIIREQEPPRPSLRLGALPAADLEKIAMCRQAEPGRLTPMLRGDLDVIAMKALEKNRNRRYDTANGLAMDLRRHLATEPVLARPPSATYRFGRLVRRHRGVFAATAAIVAALVLGLGGATISFFKERRAHTSEAEQRAIAEGQSREAQASTQRAAESELRARRFLYAADMNLASQALRANNLGRARRLLDRHWPAPDELDLRGWEWRYLWQQCRSDAAAMLTKREGVRAFSVSFSPDGKYLAVGYLDGRVELWDVPARTLAKLICEGTKMPAHVAISPLGDWLIAQTGAGRLTRVDPRTLAEKALGEFPTQIRELAFSRDGEWLTISCLKPETFFVLRVADGTISMKFRSSADGGGLHFNAARLSADHQRLYISCRAFFDAKVRCLHVPDGAEIWAIEAGRIEDGDAEGGADIGFSALDLSPDGRHLAVATGYNDPTIRILDADSGRLVKKLRGHTGWIPELAFSRDGKVLASASTDQTIRLWETTNWTKLREPLRGHGDEIETVAFTAEGHSLASGSRDGVVLLWDLRKSRLTGVGRDLPPNVRAIVAMPGGQSVFANTGLRWKIIDLATFSESAIPESEFARKSGLPRVLVEKQRRIQTAPSLQGIDLVGHLSTPVLAPDGKRFAVPSQAGLVGIYDAKSKAEIALLHGHMRGVHGVAFSPDGQRLASASGGRESVKLWDLTTFQELLTLTSSGVLLSAVEFTDDGNTLLTSSERAGENRSATCHFWRAPSWQEIEIAERTEGKWPQAAGFHTAPLSATEAAGEAIAEKYREAARLHAAGDLAGSESLWRQALALAQKISGPEAEANSDRGLVLHHLAMVMHERKLLPEAMTLTQQAVALYQQHPSWPAGERAHAQKILQLVLSDIGDLPAAERVLDELATPTPAKSEEAALLAIRGHLRARMAKWPGAAAAFAKAGEVDPEDFEAPYFLMLVRVQTGERAAYEQARKRFLDMPGGVESRTAAYRLLKASFLLPPSDAAWEAAFRFAGQATNINEVGRTDPLWMEVKALEEYRKAHYAETLALTEKLFAEKNAGAARTVTAHMLSAMASWQLKRPEDARATFDHGLEVARDGLPTGESGDLGEKWDDWVFAEAFISEARALISE